MTRLSNIDAGFLLTESQHSPKHVGGLLVLSLPKGKGPAWLRKLLADMKQASPGFPFSQKLQPGNPLQPALVLDTAFDIDYHVRHTVLPHPGSDRQLTELIARLHSTLLDRDRPLWEFHLIEGLQDRRFAMFTKVHHSIADGLTFARWFAASCSASAANRSTPPVWHQPPAAADGDEEGPGLLHLLSDGVRLFGGGVKTAAGLSTLGGRLLLRRVFERDVTIPLPLSAPRTALNAVTGAARAFAITDYPLKEIKAVGKFRGCSVNDVLMTVTDLAVNRYFREHGNPVDEPLIAYMPVNLRANDGQGAGQRGGQGDGNLISLLQVRLAREHDNPLETLRQIHESSRSAREVYSSASRSVVQYYSLMVALMTLAEEYLKLDKWLPPAINLVISNVAGPPQHLYFRGARIERVYPVSTLPPLTALNVTANSYAGTLYLGLVAGRSSIPDLASLTRHFDEACAELKKLTGVGKSPSA
ncbi:MAG: wax ester/triacylglycerol synthase family O-acyltransferase [Xanthomonadales bacterium]|nr:wax ester/triacylglycerol synthase family O-acyltransferase [Xanthomonadales bacterium]